MTRHSPNRRDPEESPAKRRLRLPRIPLVASLGWALLVTGLAVGLARTARLALDTASPSPLAYLRERYRLAVEAVSTLERAETFTVAAVGGSSIEANFNPTLLANSAAALGRKARFLNFGFRGMDVPILEAFLRRLQEESAGGPPPFDLLLVELPGLRLTRKYTENRDLSAKDLGSVLATSRSLLLDARGGPDAALSLAATKYLFGSVSAENAATQLFYRTFAIPAGAEQRLWTHPDFHNGPAWNRLNGGHFFFGLPGTQGLVHPLLAQQRSEADWQAQLRRFDACCEIHTLNIDAGELGRFGRSFEVARRLAKRVAVFLTAENPRYGRSGESDARLRSAFEQAARQASVPGIDLQHPNPLTAADFIDLYHLDESGQKRYSESLVRLLVERGFLPMGPSNTEASSSAR